MQVAVLMGSSADREVMELTTQLLDHFGVSYFTEVLSAHRNPDRLDSVIENAQTNGVRVFIAAAGMAAHLAGAIASRTTVPVIGVPLSVGELKGMDALLSTVQMPSGIPVATVSIGKAGAENAAILAVKILALTDQQLQRKLQEFMDNGCRLPDK
jgi:5-(carboxyamino)imidazole ribonucleotide mutase